MKYQLALALFAVLVGVIAAEDAKIDIDSKLSDDQKAKIKLYGEECIKQEHVTEEEANKLRLKDFTNPSDNLKCFANCFFEKVGTLKDGAVQEAVVLEKFGAIIGEEKTKKIMEQCNSLKGDNKCDTAFKIYECYEKAKSEIAA